MIEYNPHPAADAFPMMTGDRLEALKADIAENGQRLPIVLCGGQILDGRNRYKACLSLGITPKTEEYTGNPWAYVWSLNGTRRDLTDAQRALIWRDISERSEAWQAEQAATRERIEAERRERIADAATEQHKVSNPRAGEIMDVVTDLPRPEIDHHRWRAAEAEAARVGVGTMARVNALLNADAELAEKVRVGEMSLKEAEAIVKKGKRAKEIEAQREAIAKGAVEMPEGVFEVVVMDPPWAYGREYDPEGSRVANPYPEMSQDQLLDLTPPLADDSVLFLWTTHAFLFDAKDLLDAWGMTYKATLIWDKESMGMGAWLRMQCEFCLVAVRGKPKWDNTTWRDIIREKRRQHSRKPDVFYQMVEEITVGRRLDYFSREQREGWATYGNDANKF